MHRLYELKVYKKALSFTKSTRDTTKKFPKNEIFGQTAQFRRAADSVALNIAEGAGNRSKKEFAHFLDYSIRSAYECRGCLDIAKENHFIEEQIYEMLQEQLSEIIAMLHGLQTSMKD